MLLYELVTFVFQIVPVKLVPLQTQKYPLGHCPID